MYSYKPTADEQAEDTVNQKKYKKYSYNEIRRIIEEAYNKVIKPTTTSNTTKNNNNNIKNINKTSNNKNEKSNPANLFYNLFD